MSDAGISIKQVQAKVLNDGHSRDKSWILPEERPIAIRINGENYAVMLATPQNLRDFAIGFCLSENLIKSIEVITDIQIKQIRHGFEVDVKLTIEAFDRFEIMDKRRRIAGASGCGICGLTSISHIVEELPKINSNVKVPKSSILKAKQNLRDFTPINSQCFSVHAAAFANVDGDILLAREDVGRHNALDKLIGAINVSGLDVNQGFVLLTSRFAYELAQKAVRAKIPIVASLSAPSTMALEISKTCNLTYVSVEKGNELMQFCDNNRVI